MTEAVQMECINKSDRPTPHERILHVGGIHGGRRWNLRQQEAMAGIDARKGSFSGRVAGRSVAGVVATSRLGNRYPSQQPSEPSGVPVMP